MAMDGLSPDAKYIMEKLYALRDMMERKERDNPGCIAALSVDNVKCFITKLEETLPIHLPGSSSVFPPC